MTIYPFLSQRRRKQLYRHVIGVPRRNKPEDLARKMKQRWNDPQFRCSFRAAMKAHWADPSYRTNISEKRQQWCHEHPTEVQAAIAKSANSRRGKPFSEEARANMSRAKRDWWENRATPAQKRRIIANAKKGSLARWGKSRIIKH
jgi:hypothetical protein